MVEYKDSALKVKLEAVINEILNDSSDSRRLLYLNIKDIVGEGDNESINLWLTHSDNIREVIDNFHPRIKAIRHQDLITHNWLVGQVPEFDSMQLIIGLISKDATWEEGQLAPSQMLDRVKFTPTVISAIAKSVVVEYSRFLEFTGPYKRGQIPEFQFYLDRCGYITERAPANMDPAFYLFELEDEHRIEIARLIADRISGKGSVTINEQDLVVINIEPVSVNWGVTPSYGMCQLMDQLRDRN